MFTIREATGKDILPVVELQEESLLETVGFLTHTREEDIDHYANKVFKNCTVFVAEVDGKLAGYIGFRKDWVEHLRIYPQYRGMGIGKALLDKAKDTYPYLQLLVFQHIPAREFYKKQGFIEVEYTDGANNDEKLPDVRMEWRRK